LRELSLQAWSPRSTPVRKNPSAQGLVRQRDEQFLGDERGPIRRPHDRDVVGFFPFQVSRPRVIIAAYVMTGIWSVPGGHDSSNRWSDGAYANGLSSALPELVAVLFQVLPPTVKHHRASSTPLRRGRRRAVGTPHRHERLRLVHDSQLLACPSDDGQACSTAWKPVYGLAISI
jgi:hypothetical protein